MKNHQFKLVWKICKGPIMENETLNVLCDFQIRTDLLISARRANLVIVKKKKKKKKEPAE